MDLLAPHTGTIIWMTIAFLIVFLILKKFAWRPILDALSQREDSIEDALKSAEMARVEMQKLQSDNEKILAKAKLDSDKIIKEAGDLKNVILEEAKKKANEEAEKIINSARITIKNEKAAAVKEIKEQMANLSVLIAEKVLQEKLETTKEQKNVIDKFLQELRFS